MIRVIDNGKIIEFFHEPTYKGNIGTEYSGKAVKIGFFWYLYLVFDNNTYVSMSKKNIIRKFKKIIKKRL